MTKEDTLATFRRESVVCSGLFYKTHPSTPRYCRCGQTFMTDTEGDVPYHERLIVWFRKVELGEPRPDLSRWIIQETRLAFAVSPFVASVLINYMSVARIQRTAYGCWRTESFLAALEGKHADQQALIVLMDSTETVKEVLELWDEYLAGRLFND